MGRNIFVPHLEKDKKLDPKRALTYYLKATEQFRNQKGRDIVKLFLAINKPHQPVSSITLSRWLISLIKYCYKKLKKSHGKITGHSTRTVLGLIQGCIFTAGYGGCRLV